MVNGMACIITNLTRNSDRHKRVAARYWDDVNCYRLELKELKSKIAGSVAVPQEMMAPVSPSKKRKMSAEESGPCETKEVCISQPEHLPPPRSDERPDIPVLQVQESVTEEDVD
ncbi:hypothetical protein MKW94_022991, partial [Papaver nudicaule]|nr:hypothetical protein [Papaver nudicaule]